MNVPGANYSSLDLDLTQPGYSGAYTLVAVSPYGKVTSYPAVVPVYYAPSISYSPQSVTNVNGGYIQLNVCGDGEPAPVYYWRLNGQIIPGAVSYSGTPYPRSLFRNGVIYNYTTTGSYYLQTTNSGVYDVMAVNAFGIAYSSPATVTVTNGYAPSIQVQPLSVTNVIGTLATFSVAGNGNPYPAYQWRSNGVPVAGYDSAYSFVAATNANFDVILANYYGSVTSSIAALTVISPFRFSSGSSFVSSSNRQFVISMSGPAGSNAVISASTNLQNWIPLVTNPLTFGSLQFTDALATNFTRRFYRATLQP